MGRGKGRVALARIGRPVEQEVVAPARDSDVVLLTATTPYHLRALDELSGVPASTLRCAYLPELWPRQLERCPVDGTALGGTLPTLPEQPNTPCSEFCAMVNGWSLMMCWSGPITNDRCWMSSEQRGCQLETTARPRRWLKR